jgi:LysM repeat protein
MTDDGRAPQGPGAAAPVPGASDDPTGLPLHGVCPFLLSADGGWRSATAAREHRCTAVTPPAPLAAEKQRRLCLTAEHATCATYLAAGEARAAGHRPAHRRRPFARTTPLVLDHGRLTVAMPTISASPGAGQGVLIGLLVLAFGAVLLARLAGGGGSPSGVVIPIGSPTPAAAATEGAAAPTSTTSPKPTAAATSEPTVKPSPTLVPTEVQPTPAAAAPNTYKVKKGDTLSGIAATFGTTVKVLSKLNHIEDPSKIRVGQVLKLP